MSDFLVLKGGTYHVRLDIPADAREAFGDRRVLTKSLKTGNRSEAHVLKLRWLQQWKIEIEKARKHEIPDFREEVALIVEKYRDKIEAEKRNPLPWPIGQQVASSATTDRTTEISQVIKAHKLRPKQVGEAIDIIMGISDYSPKTPFFKSRLDAFHSYEKEVRKVELSTVDRHVKRLKVLDAFLKESDLPLNHDTISTFLASLKIEAKTKKQYLFSFNAFWNFAIKKDAAFKSVYASTPNPFKEHELNQEKRGIYKEASRRAFTTGEIELLYESALAESNQKLADLIEIGAYTGARIEEICQLRTDSIVIEDDIECFHIREGKTDGAVRHVPIHPKLKNTIKRLVESSKDGYLLQTGKGGKYGVKSKDLGNDFSQFKTRHGFDKKCVFHSVRKTVITLLERADVKNLVVMSLVGHEPGGSLNITFDRYSEGPTPKAKLEAIKNITYRLLPNDQAL
ncbi:tyrosine-type recombinase/integrase [Pseudomonas sp. BO3-4]|uniref:tyrosine-type recombinase/integrase n=1 Tax=Pseudomonas sp. BO3-4 TaxID=3094916 RepID=UPI002A59EF71|nr:tyrosine-type recombinase/integrase [Pseudomonas sp. BO3-4]WPO30861.1 tyrosine-type recombinase/integrase [Pseudomonas sp. BO3-4]